MKHREIRWRQVLFGAFFLGLTPMCGTTSSSPTAEGSPTLCVPGRQLECTCPRGETNFQVCSDDGSRYLPCQCPATDGSAGSSRGGSIGSSGAAAGASAAGTGAGGVDGLGGVGGSAAAGGAGQAGGDNGDDACPTADQDLQANCSGSCDGQQQCNASPCSLETELLTFNYVRNSELVIRTPSRPGKLGHCDHCTKDKSPVAAITIGSKGFYSARPMKVEVEAPWYIIAGALCEPPYEVNCRVAPGTDILAIATKDASAPARNIRVTMASDVACP